MTEKKRPREDDDLGPSDAIVAADDTGMIANEILITDVELREGEALSDERDDVPAPGDARKAPTP